MNLSNLTTTNEKPKSEENLEQISKEKNISIKRLRKEYDARISSMSLYFLSEKDWCESRGIEYVSLSTLGKESAVEISRNYAIELLKGIEKYEIFYEEN